MLPDTCTSVRARHGWRRSAGAEKGAYAQRSRVLLAKRFDFVGDVHGFIEAWTNGDHSCHSMRLQTNAAPTYVTSSAPAD